MTGAVLAEDKCDALARSVDRVKQWYGPGSRVTCIFPVLDAGNVRRLQHTGLHQLLTEFDQLRFVVWYLKTIIDDSIRLVGELIAIVKAQQEGPTMPREKRIDAIITGIEPAPVSGYAPTGPDPRQTVIAEHRKPAFFKIHYVGKGGREHVAWRFADCEKHAVDYCLSLGSVTRLFRFDDRQQLLDAMPPGRSIRSVLPPADLTLAHKLGFLLKTDLR
jgi:hypothetical protein